MTSEPQCKTCRFWSKTGSIRAFLDQGFCRRFPPTIHYQHNDNDPDDVYPWGYWPSTGEDDWCGEYKERDA